MPINARRQPPPTFDRGALSKIADLEKRMRTVESTIGTIGSIDAGTITGTISGSQIGSGTVTGTQIAPDSIASVHIQGVAVQSRHIGTSQVNGTHVASNSISSGHIQANTIQAGHIQANAIQANHIAAGQIQAGHITANAIQTNHLSAGVVTAGKIQANTITAGQIAAGTITANEIAVNTITAGNIAAGTITATQIAADTITAGNIATGTITATQLSVGSVTATQIAANAITATAIAAGSITATAIAAGAISTYVIAGNTITLSGSINNNNKILLDSTGVRGFDTAGIITFTLASADGSLTVNKGTITGTVVQTGGSATGLPGSNKVMMDSTGLTAFDGASNPTVKIDTSGVLTVTRGNITLASSPTPGTGARVTLDATGIKGFDSTNTQMFTLDATTGLISCTGVFQAQSGSAIPTGTITGALPGGANRYSNANFQDGAGVFDATGWTFSNGTAASGGTTAPPVYGGIICQVTASVASDVSVRSSTVIDNYKRVLAGLNYTFSHYVYPTVVGRQSRIDISWYDSSGALLSTTTGTPQTPTLNAWTRVTATAQAPANAAYAIGIHYIGVGAAVGDVFYIGAFQMEMGDRVSAWTPRPDEILYNTINASMIKAGTITADKITVGNLTSLSATIGGTLTAGTLNAVTVSGSTVNGNTITGGSININSGMFAVDTSGNLIANSATLRGSMAVYTGGTQTLGLDATNGLTLTVGTNLPQIISFHSGGVTGTQYGAIACGTQSTTNYMSMSASGVSGMNPSVPYQPYNHGAQVACYGDDNTGVKSVRAITWAGGNIQYNRTLIDQGGGSSYLQVANALNELGSICYSGYAGDRPSGAFGTSDWFRTSGGGGWYNYSYSIGVYPWAPSPGNVGAYNAAGFAQGSVPVGWSFVGNSGQVVTVGGSNWGPGANRYLTCAQGSLPGYGNNNYPTDRTNFQYSYFSVQDLYVAYIPVTGQWVANSSRGLKRFARELKHEDLLNKIGKLDIQEWEHKEDRGTRHIGPYAEDFFRMFRLGEHKPLEKDRTRPHHEAFISASDVASVSLAGVKALLARVKELELKVHDLEHRVFMEEVTA